jgi:putative Mg2+ transporter-C (MgtC) family protein
MDPYYQILLAALLGAVIGLERQYKRKAAGLKTYSLVSLGSCLFVIISFLVVDDFLKHDLNNISLDPTRIIGQIVLGVGFLGAGLIILKSDHVEGLTTAAGLWVASSIGATVGAGFYSLAIFTTFLSLAILTLLRVIEEKFIEKNNKKNE